MKLNGKIAIVTGAGRGIGRGIAERYAQEGADLAIPEQGQALVQRAVDHFGRIDILVNNAGVAGPKPMLELTPADWDRMFDVNARGLFFCLQAAARQMIAQGGGGKIVNIASTAGKGGSSHHTHYAATKACVISITRSAAVTLAPHRINVNAICPGIIDTDMWTMIDQVRTGWQGEEPGTEFRRAVANTPWGRAGTPADVAAVAQFLASEDADYLTGQTVNVTGGGRMD